MSTETTTEIQRFLCRHVFTDGHRCGSPALRAQPFCYYHHTARRPVPLPEVNRRRQFADVADGELPSREVPGFTLPPAADLTERSGVQHTLRLILARIASNDIDPRRASLLLYGLQIATMNLGKRDPNADAPETVDEIIEDPIHGPIAPAAEFIPKPTFSLPNFAALLDTEPYDEDGEDDEDDEEEEDQDDDEDDSHPYDSASRVVRKADAHPTNPNPDAGQETPAEQEALAEQEAPAEQKALEDDPTLRYLASLHAESSPSDLFSFDPGTSARRPATHLSRKEREVGHPVSGGSGVDRLAQEALYSVPGLAYFAGMDYSQIITMEPGTRSGKPCIRGTRITVVDVLEYLASGMTYAEVLADFPQLSESDILACLAFAADRERKVETVLA